MNKHTLVCATCQIEMAHVRSGIPLLEMYDDPPAPYNLYSADLYECHICKCRVAAHMGKPKPHFEPNFDEVLREAGPTIKVYERVSQSPSLQEG